jgi:hypothetical protein
MGRKYPRNRSWLDEYSTYHYAIRFEKDSRLYDNVNDFMAKHGGRVDDLVSKLLNDEFVLSSYTDHSYPF